MFCHSNLLVFISSDPHGELVVALDAIASVRGRRLSRPRPRPCPPAQQPSAAPAPAQGLGVPRDDPAEQPVLEELRSLPGERHSAAKKLPRVPQPAEIFTISTGDVRCPVFEPGVPVQYGVRCSHSLQLLWRPRDHGVEHHERSRHLHVRQVKLGALQKCWDLFTRKVVI